MALFTKADFVGTHVITSPAQRDFILRYSNNRGHQCFEAMSVAAGGTAPPLTLATMLQTYTLDAAGVQAVLTEGGPRGHEFLTAVTFAGDLTPAGDLSAAAGTTADPHTLTLTGWFTAGLTLDITYDTDISTPGTAPLVLTEDMGPVEVAQLYGDYLKGPDGLTTTIEDNVITFLPYAPAVQVTMSGFSIV